MRVFFDTNVLVSAFLARGLCADLLRLVLSKHTLVCSEVVLDELRAELSRKGRLPLQQIEGIEPFLRDQPVAPRPTMILQLGLVDADDEWVVVSAVLAEAELFVTGDQGVLACTNPPLPLVDPRCCWERLRDAGQSTPHLRPPAAAPPPPSGRGPIRCREGTGLASGSNVVFPDAGAVHGPAG